MRQIPQYEDGIGQSFIINSYNFQMAISKQHFLLVLICSLIVESQVLSPVSNCLGHCLTCDPLSLTHCQAPLACEWGFYDPSANGTCLLNPTAQVVSSQLEEKDSKSLKTVAPGWSDSARLAVCQYVSPFGIKFMDVLGFYEGVEMLQKTFPVDPSSQVYQFSFNLLRDEWVPFNDFLIIDISSGNQNIQTIEISYDRRITIDSQPVAITCGGKRVLSEKFNIKIQNKQRIGKTLTFLFTSFLYSSTWGLTNVELVSGCVGYSMYNNKTQSCNKCDQDSFILNTTGTQWCQKCPSLCLTCQSEKKCTTCVSGAALDQNTLCVFPQNYKTQVASLGQNHSICGVTPLKIGSLSTPIILQQLKNDNDLLYDELQLGFYLYYFPKDWTSVSQQYISVTLNKIEIIKITYKNLTNQATNSCVSFTKGKTAKIQLFYEKIVHTDNVVQLEFQLKGENQEMQFGVSDVRVKSLRKTMPASEPLKVDPVKKEEVTPVLLVQPKITINISESSAPEASLPVLYSNNSVLQSANQSNSSGVENQSIIIQPINFLPTTETKEELSNKTVDPQQSNETMINEENQPELPQSQQKIPELKPTPQNPLPILPQKEENQTSPAISDKIIEDKLVVDSPNIAFLPTCSDKKSGIQVYIDNEPQQSHLYKAYIDKLDPDQYEIDSYYKQDNKLNMFITIDHSFTKGVVSVYRYNTQRLLQQNNSPVLVGTFTVKRFDSLSENQIASVQSFAYLFTAVAWVGVIGIIVAVMSGYGIVVEEYVLALQVIFLHVYIASDYLPITFRDSVGGLSLIENLNFFLPSHSQSIERQWMGNVLQNGPVRFYLFNIDINFLREFYPIIIINIIYLLWFLCLSAARHYINRDLIDEQKTFFNKFLDNIAGRIVNFTDQIWRYQFLATMWFCFIQFYNFTYPQGSDRSEGVNTAICILSFLTSLAWPIFLAFYCRKQYYEYEYSQYLFYFEDIYYLKIPQYELPSNHHRMGYPLFKTAKLFFIALTICYCGNIPTLALVLLILIYSVEIVYIHKEEIYSDKKYLTLKIIQNCIFVAIEIVLLGLLNFSSLAVSDSYVYVGYVLSAMAFLIVVNGFVRMGFIAHQKYLSVKEESLQPAVEEEKKPKTQRVV